ncbi:MAG: hypothetical protein AB7U63_13750 [Porticoccaceae bacterium]
MEQTSSVSSLKKRLQEKTQQDQEENRALVLSEQEKLLSDLQSTYKSALDTTLIDIRDSLKSRLGDMAMLTAQEAQTVEKMVEDHQRKLTKALTGHYAKVSKSIRQQTEPATESLDRLTESLNKAAQAAERSEKGSRRRWITGLVVGLSAFLIISGASWGLLQYLSDQVQQNLATIEDQKATIKNLYDETLGLQIVDALNGTFLILPDQAETGFTVGDKPAIRLQRN